ncbi:hypothetical protein BO78DRAFT_438093 [Aspergillus sclerotiicarbonarius CBS 121057]|uniref:Ipa protein n=1 Tax=Aspergillus sclerotiicarbonarius (strain CBS 121057 / IBT 28362) TaxID=1448318 RepID=A0A319EGI8_ASPSB|nr:hypothetical protein BO78DRAFT_438093 [Aspergillus sclerotiicarbonarius CBS 121057]
MVDSTDAQIQVRALHSELEKKYKDHGPRIEEIWRTYEKPKRERMVSSVIDSGLALRHATDTTLGDEYKFVPEWNIRDLSDPNSDYLLHHLRHRATRPLIEQFYEGLYKGPGDEAFIKSSMHHNNLRHMYPKEFSFSVFGEKIPYAKSYTVVEPYSYDQIVRDLQIRFLERLNKIVDKMLDEDPTFAGSAASKKAEKAARKALSSLQLEFKPEKLSLEELVARAREQKSALLDYLHLCRSEPACLAHLVNVWFSSRPELVLDDKGRTMPRATEKYISIAMFEAVHDCVVGAVVWDFICQLLQGLINRPKDQAYRSTVLKEIANVFAFEYKRVQTLFKRCAQVNSGSGHFKRIPDVYDNGIARVTLKTKPDALTRLDPRIHYTLRLCQTDSTAVKAMDWIKKLDELQRYHPIDREAMAESEFDAFGDLAMTTSFIESLSASLPMPSSSQKKGDAYLDRLKDLFTAFDSLKTQVDLSSYAMPIEKLLQPGKAEGALKALDRFIVSKIRADIGSRYPDLNKRWISALQSQYGQQQAGQSTAGPAVPESSAPEGQSASRQKRPQTRPAHSAIFGILPIPAPGDHDTAVVSPTCTVKLSTYNVFWTLFSKSGAGESIAWTEFEAAMLDLGFSVVPRLGPLYTFCPPEEYPVQQAITLQRPQKSQIEGYRLLSIRMRLGRKYGWGEKTFEMA